MIFKIGTINKGDMVRIKYSNDRFEVYDVTGDHLILIRPGVENREEAFFDIPTNQVVKQRKTTSLMSGVEIWIDHDTSLACDPGSETYWSM